MAVTPIAATATQVAAGGTPVVAINANPQGGLLQNPVLAADQGIVNAEPLFTDPTGAPATLQGNGTTFRLEPGQSWSAIAGQTTTTSVNAATAGHKFSGIQW